MRKYIFIAGYGRSGSTILADYLAEALGGRHVGELSRFAEVLGYKDHYCSCGDGVLECAYWSDLLEPDAHYGATARAIWEGETGVVIDSSKRPAALREVERAFRGSGALHVIVLRRSWAATRRSILKTYAIDPKRGVSKGRHYRSLWISYLNWTFRNHTAPLLCRVARVPFVTVDFERLTSASTSAERDKVEALIGQKIPWTQRFARRSHTFAGNRGRFSDTIAIDFHP